MDPLALRWWVAGEQDLDSLSFAFVATSPSGSSSYNPVSTSRSSRPHNCDRWLCLAACFDRQSPVDNSTPLSQPSSRVFRLCLEGVPPELENPLTLGFKRRLCAFELGDGVCSSSVGAELRRPRAREKRTMAVHEPAMGMSQRGQKLTEQGGCSGRDLGFSPPRRGAGRVQAGQWTWYADGAAGFEVSKAVLPP